eukprot:138828_1
MATMLCTLLMTLSAVRSLDLDHIKEYELLHLNIDSNGENPVLEFSAFSVDYKIGLQPNNDLIPANIRHTNGNPTLKSGGDPYFTSQTKTCHYFGRLIAPDTTAIISVSMCNKRGIRADIRVHGETLILRPSALYLEDNPQREHSFTDEYIVYKLPHINALFNTLDHDVMKNIIPPVDTPSNRRNLAKTNGGDNKVEVLVLIHGSLRLKYEEAFDDDTWYEQVTADITTAINTVSTIYKDTDWTYEGQDNIGEITWSIAEFEVVDYSDPFYMDLVPDFIYSNCKDETNEQCGINGGGWLDIIGSWIDNTRGRTETYDNIMMMHSLSLCTRKEDGEIECGWAGQGKMGTMCGGSSSASTNRLGDVTDWSKTQWAYTMTHEGGHNFDLFTPRCNADRGLMGYGDVNDYFSSCSKKEINAFFEDEDLSCLANTRDLEVITNYGPNKVRRLLKPKPTARTARPTSEPTSRPNSSGRGSGSSDCWEISGYKNTRPHGCFCYDEAATWAGIVYSNLEDGEKVYSRTVESSGEVLYLYSLMNTYWAVDEIVGSMSVRGYSECEELGDECTRWTSTYGCSQAFTVEEACYDEEVYNEQVCVRSNDTTVFEGETQWIVDPDGACAYDQPIYYLQIINEETDFKQTYYLHYDLSDDPRWIVSAFRVSTAAVAVCEKINLFDCLDGSWVVYSVVGDAMDMIDAATMGIYNEACWNEVSEPTNGDSGLLVLAILSGCVVLLAGGICVFIYSKRRNGKGTASFAKDDQTKAIGSEVVDVEMEETEQITLT